MSFKPRCVVVGLVVLSVSAGCGRTAYLERLDQTRRWFAYQDRLNQYLDTIAREGKNVRLRAPKAFHAIEPGKTKSGEESGRDARQPKWAELDFDGLQGAWQASLPLTGNEGYGPAWLYLLSNYDLLAKKENAAKAADFNNDVIRRIAKAVGEAVPEKLQVHDVPFKRGEDSYIEKMTFHAILPGIADRIDDKPYRIRIYNYQKPKSATDSGAVVPEIS